MEEIKFKILHQSTNRFIDVVGEKVIFKGFEDYYFAVHKSIEEKEKRLFKVSECSTGATISLTASINKEMAIALAKERMGIVTMEKFKDALKKCRNMIITEMEKQNDPLFMAMDASGLQFDAHAVDNIKEILLQYGYEIKPVSKLEV